MKPTVTSQKAPLGILGEHLIDEAAVQQMKRAMELPVSIAGYLLPDAHVGYGIPIGGVWATRNANSWARAAAATISSTSVGWNCPTAANTWA